jgi:4,5-DOPA dioxygenase extradiol
MRLKNLKKLTENFGETDRMPVLFVGHGSPMNAIEDNEFSRGWVAAAKELPKPNAILCVSAHWLTRGVFVTAMEKPKTIHDYYGFPQALFDVRYPCAGSPVIAEEVMTTVKSTEVKPDQEWGLDHGTWSILNRMFPAADVPVLQLSIDYYQPGQFHYDLAKELSPLREKGVLIIGSGNIVHNLRLAKFGANPTPYDWAIEFDNLSKRLIESKAHDKLIDWESLGEAAKLSIPTPDHYFPMLYALGLQGKEESLTFFNEQLAFGAGSMRSFRIG